MIYSAKILKEQRCAVVCVFAVETVKPCRTSNKIRHSQRHFSDEVKSSRKADAAFVYAK